MGIILLPFMIFSAVYGVRMFKEVIVYIKNKKYEILLIAFILACIEVFALLMMWQIQGEIYAFAPAFIFMIFFIIIPSLLSPLIKKVKINNIVKANIAFIFLILVLYQFILSFYINIFDHLGISVYY